MFKGKKASKMKFHSDAVFHQGFSSSADKYFKKTYSKGIRMDPD